MGTTSLKDKVCFLVCLALMLICSAAKRQYFFPSKNLNWDGARRHCQACFKDLVTLTPENIQTIAQNLTSESWIGLRKNFNSTGNSNYTSNSNATSNFRFTSNSNATTNSNSTNDFNSTSNSNATSNFNSTSDSSMPWSHWANGDPLTFQNWYPGWPVFKSSIPKKQCCSCSCTCPARPTPTTLSVTSGARGTWESSTQNVTDNTTIWTSTTQDVTDDTTVWTSTTQDVTDDTGTGESTTQNMAASTQWMNSTVFTTPAPMSTSLPPVAAECVRSPIVSDDPEPDENFVEDSCVAMLSFGAWVERNCLELLPFICYEDRFLANANVTDVTSTSATVSWLAAPGDISHYRLEVKSDKDLTKYLTTDPYNLTYPLDNLTAGTGYSVQVFPVKCERDLDPQEDTFYTYPNKVRNLSVFGVTNTSVSLRWNEPVGNAAVYVVKVTGRAFENETETKALNVTDLLPGTQYTFAVLSGVEDKSKWSEESNITAYTRPGRVSNLEASNNTNNSLLLSWEPPKGNVTVYRVMAMDDSGAILFHKNVTTTQVRVDQLPRGSRITLSVTVRVGDTQEGDTVTIFSHTAPGPISDLVLVPESGGLRANWIAPPGNYSSFVVKLKLKHQPDDEEERVNYTTNRTACFTGLKTATEYTVTVYILSGHNLLGPPVSASNFTRPEQPHNAAASQVLKDQITFQWDPPSGAGTVTYLVQLTSKFWGDTWSYHVKNKTNCTFKGLKSGTTYEFEVRVLAGAMTSSAEKASAQTVPVKREISLSMLCSSSELLLCDQSDKREKVFQQLEAHFRKKLGDNIFWKLEKYETNN